jgi:hypothetical protein
MANESKRIRDNLRINLPGALDGVLQLELFNTVDEFCRGSMAWTETLSIPLIAGQVTYLPTPANQVILTVYVGTHPTADLSGMIYDQEQFILTLITLPTAADVAAGNLLLDVALAPTADTPVDSLLPGRLWTRFHQSIFHGCMGRMMSQKAKPYSDPTLGTYHLRRFHNFMALARANSDAGAVPDGQAWSFPKWA